MARTIEEHLQLVIQEAARVHGLGLLVRNDDAPEDEDDDFWYTPIGDRETIYSLASWGADSWPGRTSYIEVEQLIVEKLSEIYHGFS